MKRGEASLRSEASVKEAELAMPPASQQTIQLPTRLGAFKSAEK